MAATKTQDYARYGLQPGNAEQRMFDLVVELDGGVGSPRTETFSNITFAGDASQTNRVDRVLAEGSMLLRFPGIPDSQGKDGPKCTYSQSEAKLSLTVAIHFDCDRLKTP